MNWKIITGIILIFIGTALFFTGGYSLITSSLRTTDGYRAWYEEAAKIKNQNNHYAPGFFPGIKTITIIAFAIRTFIGMLIGGLGIFLYRKGRKEIIISPAVGQDS